MQIYNIFDKNAKEREKQKRDLRIVSKASERYKDKPFLEEYYLIDICASFISKLCDLFSIAASTLVIYFILSISFKTENSIFLFIYAALSFGVSVLIELMKTSFLKSFFTSWNKYKKVAIFVLVGSLTTQTISIYLSFKGGEMLPNLSYKEQVFNSSEFDQREQDIKSEIQAIRTQNTYKNKITQEGNRFLKDANERLAKLDKERMDAKQLFLSSVEADKIELNENTNLLGLISIAAEFIILLCLGINSYYEYRVHDERTDTQQAPPQDKVLDKKELAKIAIPTEYKKTLEPPVKRNPIGFVIEKEEQELFLLKPEPIKEEILQELEQLRQEVEQKGDNQQREKIDEKSKSSQYWKKCFFCEKDFYHKHNIQKFCSTECRTLFHNNKRKK